MSDIRRGLRGTPLGKEGRIKEMREGQSGSLTALQTPLPSSSIGSTWELVRNAES